MREGTSFGDPIPADCAVIELRVKEPTQIFSAIDPSPFRERDLAPSAEEFIVSRSKELPRAAPPGLVIHLDRSLPDHQGVVLRDAVHQHFAARAGAARRRLRELFRHGRISLVIGLAFLGMSLGTSQLMEKLLDPGGMLDVIRASLSIGGWVAMWRPMEVFLYDWWPIRAEARLYDRLATMPVCIRYAAAASNA